MFKTIFKGTLLIILCLLMSISLAANVRSVERSKVPDIEQEMKKLDKINFHPTLLPLIMKNMDTIGLNVSQINAFNDWRNETAPQMIKLMKAIALERLAFQKNTITPGFSEEKLIEQQEEIFLMQKELLSMKLKCRKILMGTFSSEQWDNLLFVISEEMPIELN